MPFIKVGFFFKCSYKAFWVMAAFVRDCVLNCLLRELESWRTPEESAVRTLVPGILQREVMRPTEVPVTCSGVGLGAGTRAWTFGLDLRNYHTSITIPHYLGFRTLLFLHRLCCDNPPGHLQSLSFTRIDSCWGKMRTCYCPSPSQQCVLLKLGIPYSKAVETFEGSCFSLLQPFWGL